MSTVLSGRTALLAAVFAGDGLTRRHFAGDKTKRPGVGDKNRRRGFGTIYDDKGAGPTRRPFLSLFYLGSGNILASLMYDKAGSLAVIVDHEGDLGIGDLEKVLHFGLRK